MNKKLLEVLSKKNKTHANILLELRSILKKIKPDSISIEFSAGLLLVNGLFSKDEINFFFKTLCDVFPTINYEKDNLYVRMLPATYETLLQMLNDDEEKIIKVIKENNSKPSGKTYNVALYNDLLEKLRKAYNFAPPGDQMTLLHLFGILYNDKLSKVSVQQLAIEVTGKKSLAVEINKGRKLSEYVDVKNVDIINNLGISALSELDFGEKIVFSKAEKLIFNKNNAIITNNERIYIYTNKDRDLKSILTGGYPCYFKCMDFEWKGSTWKDLTTSFYDWFIDQIGLLENDILKIKAKWSKQPIFVNKMMQNHIGPFKFGIYVNASRTVNQTWWQIIDVIKHLPKNYNTDSIIHIRYPSNVEPNDIIELIWKTEMNAFQDFLRGKGINEEKIKQSIPIIKRMNNIYRVLYPNYIFSNIDGEQDFKKAIKRIKKMSKYKYYANQYDYYLNLFIEFKKSLVYANIGLN